MHDELELRIDELTENPTARVPVCLVLDTSSSMSGNPIKELNAGVSLFFDAIKEDEVARYSAEIAIVTFGMSVEKLLDFCSIDKQRVPTLKANGYTPMGEGVNFALDLLEQRKTEYSTVGVDYYQPWMVLMTDGQPTDDIIMASQRTKKLVENRKLTIFPIGIGPNADLTTLAKFSPREQPVRLKGLNFRAFFEWLSQSVAKTSQSMPGEKVDLPPIQGWATL
ncbi:VWA domain-containing protein [Candidatus Parabeggiatoa sp. HSG14]|uniref:vWA domain-containing protein n=1 Tax=Candidatus Parabeggiatoa sp. HSG14 TaxID=3055593 RepID=UPI0025A7D524|nr:VWA domain-containing protein [Thiotrichales bacterium HSG14]